MSQTYSREPDRPGSDVQIHEIVNDATLQVVLDTIDDDLLAHVHELEISVLILVTIVVNRFVDLLIHLDAVAEILGRLLGILATVVGTGRFDVADVGHDELLVITLALYKEDLDSMVLKSVHNPFAALLCRVSGIKDADDTPRLKPSEHVVDSSLGSLATFAFTFGIVHVEEVSSGLRSIMTTVVADVEDLSRNGQPLQVSLGWTTQICQSV